MQARWHTFTGKLLRLTYVEADAGMAQTTQDHRQEKVDRFLPFFCGSTFGNAVHRCTDHCRNG
eukprot:12923281-Prorocentrum_lima.AAC.1